MRKLLTIALLALGISANADTVAIDTNGWNCFWTVSSMGTNAPLFNPGCTGIMVDGLQVVTNIFDPSTANFKLYVTSQGYDASGNSTTYTRTVYGTKLVRKAYPNNALADTDGSGGNAKLNIALSEGVSANDTVSFDIAQNTYSNGGTNCSSASGTCVNNSALQYPKIIANWTDYSWNAETNSTMALRCFAYEQHARDGKPVACVAFTVSNSLSESWTTNVTVMELSRGRNGTEILPVGEYVARVPLSGFTQGTKLICQFKAYPWIGNAASLCNTGDGTHIMPSANAAPITNICNKTGAYGSVCFVCDPGGSDANGRCATNGDPTSIASTNYFLTPCAGLNIAMGSNNTYFSRNDIGNVQGYCKAGSYTWAMTGKAYGAKPDVIPTIQPYPGLTASDVSISNNSVGSSSQPVMVRFKNVTINSSTAGGTWLSTSNNSASVWIFDGCALSAPNTTQIGAASNVVHVVSLAYFVDCTVSKWGQGFVCKGGGAMDTYPLLRGCNLAGFTNLIAAGTRLGNYVTATNAGPNFYQLVSDQPNQGAEIIDPQIDYNNFWGCMQLGSSAVQLAKNYNVTNGYFIGNDVFEYVTNITPSGRFDFGTANGLNYTNVCMVECLVLGAPGQVRYNDDTTNPSWGIWYQIAYVFFGNFDIKTDIFTGGSSGASGGRVGNWWELYGCGFEGIAMAEMANLQSSGSFLPEFGGLNLGGVNIDNTTGGGRTDVFGARVSFVNPQMYDGTVRTGNGDYRWQNESLIHRLAGLRRRVLLPYDPWGNQRGDRSPICFSEADLNK